MTAQRSAPGWQARQSTRTKGGKAATGRQASTGRLGALTEAAERCSAVGAAWGPTVARILLGLVLAWFGYHELVQPGLWTGYVPLVSSQSSLAIALVLVHGWVLLILAVALVAGIMTRTAAAISTLLLLEIIISLTVTGGLSDLTLRDVGVLGLAVGLTGTGTQRLTLRR